MSNKTKYPTGVEFYVSMGIRAAQRRSGLGGSWRLWVLAKSIDTGGGGSVSPINLKNFSVSIGVTKRTYQNWMREAINNGLLRLLIAKRGKNKGEQRLIILSDIKLANLMGIKSVQRKVGMEARHLIGKGWKARVFSGIHAQESPQSREFIQKTYNVPARTQRNRDKQSGTVCVKNYAVSEHPASNIDFVRDNTNHKAIFIHKGFVAWRLPDTRYSKCCISQVVAQKFRSDGKHSLNSGNTRDVDVAVKLFCNTEKEIRKSLAKIDKFGVRVSEIYKTISDSTSARLHEVVLQPVALW